MTQELIAKLESASEGSRELDAEVVRVFGGQAVYRFGDWDCREDGTGIWRPLPRYSSSIDAALALAERVLPGWYCGVQPWFHTDPDRVMSRAYLVRPDWRRWNPVDDEWVECRSGKSAATPALAICAAILRATDHAH